MRNYILHSF